MAITPASSVALIGAGTQGRRLAYMWSKQGHEVRLIDSQPNQLQASLEYIQMLRSSSSASEENKWGEITTHSPESMSRTLMDTWLVVECVPERLSLKREVILSIDSTAPADTIIASNSSSYTISEILEGLQLKNDKRVLSAHSYWPPETTVIEIMGHRNTDASCITLLMKQCREHGFNPFHVKQDSLGYIYNRIWAAIKREALFAAAEGVATPEEIDEIFKDVLKTPKGPFQQMDIVGLDVVLDIEEHYAAARPGIPLEPRVYLRQLVQDHHLGVKTGKGFYSYKEGKCQLGSTTGVNGLH